MNLYGGLADLVNGSTDSKVIDRALKFAALFYEHIIVPDGFFHCYGPLATYARSLSPSALEASVLGRLLQHGFVVPAIREGDSIYSNWNGSRMGVYPGEFLILKRDDGDFLGHIDELTATYTSWPPAMDDARSTRFGPTLMAALERERTVSLPVEEGFKLTSADTRWVEWQTAKAKMIDAVAEVVASRGGQPEFRRGDVENVVRRELKNLGTPIPLASYDELVRPLSGKRPYDIPTFGAAYRVLTLASTVYEAYQSELLETVGGLFEGHSRWVAAGGLYRPIDKNVPESREVILRGTLDVDAISLDDIVKFRSDTSSTSPFRRYLGQLSAVRVPGSGETFLDVNGQFIEFLKTKYIPATTRLIKGAGEISRILSALIAGAGPVLLEVGVGTPNTFIRVAGGFLAVLVQPYIESQVDRLIAPLQQGHARKSFIETHLNQYARWGERE